MDFYYENDSTTKVTIPVTKADAAREFLMRLGPEHWFPMPMGDTSFVEERDHPVGYVTFTVAITAVDLLKDKSFIENPPKLVCGGAGATATAPLRPMDTKPVSSAKKTHHTVPSETVLDDVLRTTWTPVEPRSKPISGWSTATLRRYHSCIAQWRIQTLDHRFFDSYVKHADVLLMVEVCNNAGCVIQHILSKKDIVAIQCTSYPECYVDFDTFVVTILTKNARGNTHPLRFNFMDKKSALQFQIDLVRNQA